MSNVDVPPENDSDENEIESPVDGPTPDWMKMATASSSTPSLTEDNTPDWLRGIQSGKSFDEATGSGDSLDESDSEMSDLERLLAEEGVDLSTVEEDRPEGASGMSARDWMIATSDDEMIRNRVGEEATELPATPPPDTTTTEDDTSGSAGMSDIERLLAEEGVDLSTVEEDRPEGASGMSARDWMISTSEDEMIRNRVGEEEPADEALPDWLEEVEEEPALAVEPPVSAVSDDGMIDEEGLPDWLQEVAEDETAFTEPEAEPEVAVIDSDLPDWLRDVEEEEPVVAEQAVAEDDKMVIDEDLPDWLQEVAEDEPVPEPEPAEPVAATEDDKMVIEDDLPDWLRDVEEEVAAVPHDEVVTESEDESGSEQDLPDWLRDVEQEVVSQPPSQPVVSVDPEAAAEDDKMVIDEALPDWLQEEAEAEVELEAEPVFSIGDSEIAADSDLPDWLRDVEEEDEAGQVLEPEMELVAGAIDVDADDDDLPDWLRAVQDDGDEATEPEPLPALAAVEHLPDEEESFEADALPDWLQEVQDAPDEESEALFAASAESADDLIVEDELPDWLSEAAVGEDEIFEPSEVTPEFEEGDVAEEALPDWLRDVEEEPVEEVAAVTAADVIEEDLPDWLQGVDTDIDEGLEAEPIAEEIEPEPVVAQIEPEPEPPVEVVAEEPVGEVEEIVEPEPEPEPVPEPEPTPTPAAPPVATGGMPDWLRKLRQGDGEPAARPAQPVAPPPVPVPEPQPAIIRAQTVVQPEPDDSEAEEISFGDLPEDPDDRLKLAQSTRDSGDIDQATRVYESLVASSAHLDTVIDGIELMLRTYPSNFKLYQVMGDAMMKDGRLQGALEAYRKALEKLAG